jgi:MFS family permease
MKNKLFKGISANVLLLGIISFLNDVSSEMIMPILPMFITALGGTSIWVGLIGGVRDSVTSLLKVLGGYWSDKTGKRKRFLFFGYLSSPLTRFLLAFSQVWQHILLFSGLERIGKGIRTAPRDAIIADSMPAEKGKGFGVHRALDSLGAILGSIIVFLLFWFFSFSFKPIILVAALVASLSILPLYFVKDEKRRPQDMTLAIGLRKLSKPLKIFIFISSIFALGNFSYMFFILRAQEYFTGKLSIAMPILLYILFNIFYTIFAIPFGILADKIGRRKVILLGYFLFSLTCIGFAFFYSLIAFLLLFALYGIVYAILEGTQRAFVSDLSPKGLRGTALGTFHTIIGIASLPAGLIAGALWQGLTPQAAFLFGSIISLTSVILLGLLGKYVEASTGKNTE